MEYRIPQTPLDSIRLLYRNFYWGVLIIVRWDFDGENQRNVAPRSYSGNELEILKPAS